MTTFKSLTTQDLLKEVAEYLRLRGLQEGLIASPCWRGRTTKAQRNRADAKETVLDLVANELDSAKVIAFNDQGRTRIGNTPTCPLCDQQHGSDDECASPANGYDYKHQAWVVAGCYVACGHSTPCSCYGRIHAGEPIAPDAEIH